MCLSPMFMRDGITRAKKTHTGRIRNSPGPRIRRTDQSATDQTSTMRAGSGVFTANATGKYARNPFRDTSPSRYEGRVRYLKV